MLKKIILTPLFIILMIVVYIAGNAFSIYTYGENDYAHKADCIIVLGASVQYKRVSPVYRERINHGIQLLNAGYAHDMILTGGRIPGQIYSDASVARSYAISQGVSAKHIMIEEKSTETLQNLQNSQAIMKKHGLKSAIIVSDPLHMRRAMTMARDLGITAYSSPTPTTVYRTAQSKKEFLEKEVMAYIYYKLDRNFHRIF